MLSERQRAYLRELEQGPKFRPRNEPVWLDKLWIAGLIDFHGASIYITEAGRLALSQEVTDAR